jgi:2-oxoglutarate ferredoxin oxidoreductase subunit alpha
MRELLNGSEAIVRGALDSGCNFFAGYPITPATQILLQMINEVPRAGGVAIQAEDEIAAIGMCIGAVMAGAKAMTATSGPGISLYSENIGLAIMAEIPIVIVDCQRMGPATGAATTGAQSDTQFLRWGTSGGFPVIVLAPMDILDCYRLTRHAFNLAERFRVPVFVATDREMAATTVTVDCGAYPEIPVRERQEASKQEEYVPYLVKEDSDVAPMSAMGGPHIVRMTTSSHDEYGYLTKSPDVLDRLNKHLMEKIEKYASKIAFTRADMEEGAETLIISYGIMAQSMFAAVELARERGIRISALGIQTLWPVPEKAIRKAMKEVKRVVVPELNFGQYRREIERLARPEQKIISINRVNGELITPDEILEKGLL